MTYKVSYWDTEAGQMAERDATTEEAAEIDSRKAGAVTAAKSAAIRKIDVDVDVIYGAVLGNRAEEYRIAKEEAQAYKDAGYTGTVPASVSGYVTAKGWTATQATDDILATAAAWLAAKDAIRAARLLRKEQVRIATTQADINTAMAAWQAFVVYIKGQLGIS